MTAACGLLCQVAVAQHAVTRLKPTAAAQAPQNPTSTGVGARGKGSNQVFGVQFSDATANLGVVLNDSTFGAGSWGDFNNDGWPDLWLNNHANYPSILLNQGDGTFVDIGFFAINLPILEDAHGSAWGDIDRDGDLDLIESVGASHGNGFGPNLLWINEGNSTFTERAVDFGVEFGFNRGRSALWFDWNFDGRLDLLLTSIFDTNSVDTLVTQQTDGTFLDEGPGTGFMPTTGNSKYGQLGDFDDNGTIDLLIQAQNFPERVLDFSSGSFVEISQNVGVSAPVRNVADSVIADLDGDLDPDLYFARFPYWGESEVGLDGNSVLRALMILDGGTSGGFRFDTFGEVTVTIEDPFPFGDVFLGQEGTNPGTLPVVLQPRSKVAAGIFNNTANLEGLFIGREIDADTWVITGSSSVRQIFSVLVTSDQPITDYQPIGFIQNVLPPDLLLMRETSGLEPSLPDYYTSGRGVVAGDFDNDMDLDLYVVRSGAVLNLSNVLYENLGGGQFVPTLDASGAAGTLGGVGDNVSLVDYDQDGFLDLFVANGWGNRLTAQSGLNQLFHNEGNSNHWLQIDLEGTASNVHGIGAQVFLTAGGVTQYRVQDGGMHRSTQNHQRLHFGMGAEVVATSLEVQWPSGTVQILNNVSADQILKLVEP
jgi:ASPIC/UnbV protein/VCBS repeat protein